MKTSSLLILMGILLILCCPVAIIVLLTYLNQPEPSWLSMLGYATFAAPIIGIMFLAVGTILRIRGTTESVSTPHIH